MEALKTTERNQGVRELSLEDQQTVSGGELSLWEIGGLGAVALVGGLAGAPFLLVAAGAYALTQ